jgi:high frequency lysogenization protein
MRLRIQVAGSAIYLQQPAIAQRIRCLLFAAIRSAFLWQQLGGTRVHLVLYRKNLVRLLPQL